MGVLRRWVLAGRAGRNESWPLTSLGCGAWARKFQTSRWKSRAERSCHVVQGSQSASAFRVWFCLVTPVGLPEFEVDYRKVAQSLPRSDQIALSLATRSGILMIHTMTTPISPFVVLPYYHRLWERQVAVGCEIELRYEGVAVHIMQN